MLAGSAIGTGMVLGAGRANAAVAVVEPERVTDAVGPAVLLVPASPAQAVRPTVRRTGPTTANPQPMRSTLRVMSRRRAPTRIL
jgi:hypothetical protein